MLLLQGRISSPQNMTLCVIGRARFERNCGKMYSRHLFPYGGLKSKTNGPVLLIKTILCEMNMTYYDVSKLIKNPVNVNCILISTAIACFFFFKFQL